MCWGLSLSFTPNCQAELDRRWPWGHLAVKCQFLTCLVCQENEARWKTCSEVASAAPVSPLSPAPRGRETSCRFCGVLPWEPAVLRLWGGHLGLCTQLPVSRHATLHLCVQAALPSCLEFLEKGKKCR